MAEINRCPNCGKPIEANINFCPYCGAEIDIRLYHTVTRLYLNINTKAVRRNNKRAG